MATDVTRYGGEYSDEGFWAKVRRYARKAGREVLEKAFLLYYVLKDPSVPAWAKGVVAGALGYFILPVDAVPDVVPGVGFTDDLAVMAGALLTVAAHVTEEMRERARRAAEAWL